MIKCNACVDGFDCYTDENGDDQLCEVCGGTGYIIELFLNMPLDLKVLILAPLIMLVWTELRK